jgi:hypothetical protein
MALQTTDRCAQHPTHGYFLAYRGFGDKGKGNQWLDEKIDQIANTPGNDLAIYRSFKLLHMEGKILRFSLFLRLIFPFWED